MPTQDELTRGIKQDIFQASLDEAIIRERNDPLDPIQRSVITDRGATSDYKVQALLRACIHGRMDGASSSPASLIVLDYQLQSLKQDSIFTSVTTSFTFSEHPDTSEESKALPSVIAYAPFERPVKLNQSTATEGKTTTTQFSISPQVKGISLGNFTLGRDKTSSHEQKYFEQGRAGRHYDHGRPNLVWWNLVHNRSQGSEVTPQFRVAILIERKGSAKFQADFKIAASGGFGYKIQELKNRWLYKTAIDDPVIFDPEKDPMGDLEGVDANELGKLRKRERLEVLSYFPGLEILGDGGQ
ncbi:Hypothetical protein NCS54_01398700 [Fusarium falciforme]|uniref:Hypothetical protein n=1 Tax=Fusarium falciforme TaxID=195108 RepID=UPI002301DF8B|nr:Hypothetical protein NCS54_01398700 [Fusarium falciforme]WAO96318.1 Hypothetical protein NCS54_01398700 [Fusarium falciforme]